MRVAISGFGRIGRCVLRALLERPNPNIEVVAINSPGNPRTLAHLLKYDTTYGTLPFDVKWEPDGICVASCNIPCISERDPSNIDWKAFDVNLVMECSGEAKEREHASRHLSSGATTVLIGAPSPDADLTVIPGCNLEDYNPSEHQIVSMGSCTTNCLAVTLKVLSDRFGVESGFATTVHSYTNDQRLLDGTHEDLRRARAAGQSLIPTKTGASSTIDRVFPELKGKIACNSIRAPTSTVSLLTLVALLKTRASDRDINMAYRQASLGGLKGILGISNEPLVSVDFKKDPHSSIVDTLSTAVNGDTVRVLAWYDNEWAYSLRLIETALYICGAAGDTGTRMVPVSSRIGGKR